MFVTWCAELGHSDAQVTTWGWEINGMSVWTVSVMILSGEDGSTPVPLPHCPPQISYELIWERTWVFALNDRRLTASTMVRPTICCSVSMVGRLEFRRRDCGFLLITYRPCISLKGLREATINTGMGTNRSNHRSESQPQLKTKFGDWPGRSVQTAVITGVSLNPS